MLSIINNRLSLLIHYPKGPFLGFICLLLIAGIFIAGLWPFNFIPNNEVDWIKNETGIRFNHPGIVYSQKPLVIQKARSNNTAFSIELILRPHKGEGYMSIFTLYDKRQEHFMIGQHKKELYIRVPRSAVISDDQKRYREIGIDNTLEEDITHLITVTSNKKSTDIYVDGHLKEDFSNFSLIPEDHGLSEHLILGNAPEGTQSWDGIMFGLAIYDRMLNDTEVLDHYHEWNKQEQPRFTEKGNIIALYLFDEHSGSTVKDHSGLGNELLAPAIFQPLHRIVLEMPSRSQVFTRSNLIDIATNILGFVPFGFFLAAWLHQTRDLPLFRVFWTILLLGFCLSLTIELAQEYLPTRDSSLLDVLNNVSGTAGGALLYIRIAIRPKETEDNTTRENHYA